MTTTTTTPEQVRALARRVFDEMWNARDITVIDQVFSPDVVFHSPIQVDPIHGRAGVAEFVQRIYTGFPDFHTTIQQQLVEGDTTAVRFRVTGTHLGPYLGMPPTGRRIDTTQIVMNRIAGNQIVEVHQEINALRKLDQMGVLPPMGAGPFGLLGWAFKTIGRFAVLQARHQRRQRTAD